MKVVLYHYLEPYLSPEEEFCYEINEYEKAGIGIEILHCSNDEEVMAKECRDADTILCYGNPPITDKLLEALPRLKVVFRYGIGVNSIDVESAKAHGVVVYFMPGYCIEDLAIHATSLILSLLRNTSLYDRKMREGLFLKGKGYLPRRLSNMTLGLYGFGGSGKIMANVFSSGFQSRVIANDPLLTDETAKSLGVEKVDFETLLQCSDAISIHAPLTKETYHAFSVEQFKKMKSNSIIVNISRGGIIDEAALTDALTNGTIGFAGLDVFEKEPLEKDNPLLKMDKVVLTPHSAYYSKEANEMQRKLATILPIAAMQNGKVSKRWLANPGVLNSLKEKQWKEDEVIV